MKRSHVKTSCVLVLSLVGCWVATGGGLGKDVGKAITASGSNSYALGEFTGQSTFGATSYTSFNGSTDIFLSKLNSEGGYLWTTRFGTTSEDKANDIITSSNGANYFLTGKWGESSFLLKGNTSNGSYVDYVTSGGFYHTVEYGPIANSGGSLYVASKNSTTEVIEKYDTNLNYLDFYRFSYYIGSGGYNSNVDIHGMVTDSSGNLYVLGSFAGSVTLAGQTYTSYAYNDWDTFLIKMNNTLVVTDVVHIRNNQNNVPEDIAIDANQNVYITGKLLGTLDFGAHSLSQSIGSNVYVTKFNSSLQSVWARKFSHGSVFEVKGITIAQNSTLAITGEFANSSSTTSPYLKFGSDTLISNGGIDVFLAALYLSDGDPAGALGGGGAQNDTAQDAAANNIGAYMTGSFQGAASFQTEAPASGDDGITTVTSQGGEDVLIWQGLAQ